MKRLFQSKKNKIIGFSVIFVTLFLVLGIVFSNFLTDGSKVQGSVSAGQFSTTSWNNLTTIDNDYSYSTLLFMKDTEIYVQAEADKLDALKIDDVSSVRGIKVPSARWKRKNTTVKFIIKNCALDKNENKLSVVITMKISDLWDAPNSSFAAAITPLVTTTPIDQKNPTVQTTQTTKLYNTCRNPKVKNVIRDNMPMVFSAGSGKATADISIKYYKNLVLNTDSSKDIAWFTDDENGVPCTNPDRKMPYAEVDEENSEVATYIDKVNILFYDVDQPLNGNTDTGGTTSWAQYGVKGREGITPISGNSKIYIATNASIKYARPVVSQAIWSGDGRQYDCVKPNTVGLRDTYHFNISPVSGKGIMAYNNELWHAYTREQRGTLNPDKIVNWACPDYSLYNAETINPNVESLWYGTSAQFLVSGLSGEYKFQQSASSGTTKYTFVSPMGYQPEEPIKEVDKTTVSPNEVFTYTLKQYIPNNYHTNYLNYDAVYDNIPDNNYLTDFSFEDDIDSRLTIDSNNITITDSSGNDLSQYFTINVTGNKITTTKTSAADSYFQTYGAYNTYFNLNVPVKYVGTLSEQITIPNKGKSTMKIGDEEALVQDTNEVEVSITPNAVNLTYDCRTNGGNEEDYTIPVPVGQNVDLSRLCTKNNSEFLGWGETANSNSTMSVFVMPNQDTTIYGLYTSNTVISTTNQTKVYDGTALDATNDCTASNLISGDTVTCTILGSRTNVGETAKTITSVAIMRGSTDVTSEYTYTTRNAKIIITPRDITCSTGSASRVYNGRQLTNSELSCNNLVTGHTSSGTNTGKITNVGTTNNTTNTNSIVIKDSNSTAVTSNYRITNVTLGTLTVTPRPTTCTSGTGSKPYDGTPLTNGEITCTNLVTGHDSEGTNTGTITNVGSTENPIDTVSIVYGETDVTSNYTITKEYGTLTITPMETTCTSGTSTKVYDGTPLTNAELTCTGLMTGDVATGTNTGTITNVGSAENTIGTVIITNGGIDVTSNYTITKVNGTLTVTPLVTTCTSGTDTKVYDGSPLTNGQITCTDLMSGDVASGTNTGTITNVGSAENTIGTITITRGTTDVTNNYTITRVNGALTVTPLATTCTSGTDTKVYDGTPLTNGEITCTNLVSGDAASGTNSGTITNVGNAENTLETVIIKKGETDVTNNYTITKVNGTLTVTPRPTTCTSGTDTKVYDGTPLTNSDLTCTNLVSGDAPIGANIGTITNVGSTDNRISTIIIKKGETDVTDNYTITKEYGALTVTPLATTCTSGTDTKVYDGTPLTNGEITCTNLVSGDAASGTNSGTITNVGNAENTLETVIIKKGETDITNNYTITKVNGALTVTPLETICTSGTDTKVYDGTPLTNGEITCTNLVSGDAASGTNSGTITNVGNAENTLETVIIKKGETDVTNNYTITKANGTLTVTPLITVITLDNMGAVEPGTPELYEICDTGIYINVDDTPMTENTNSIELPVKTGYAFDGYYLTKEYKVQVITSKGYITSSLTPTVCQNRTIYAKWIPVKKPSTCDTILYSDKYDINQTTKVLSAEEGTTIEEIRSHITTSGVITDINDERIIVKCDEEQTIYKISYYKKLRTGNEIIRYGAIITVLLLTITTLVVIMVKKKKA